MFWGIFWLLNCRYFETICEGLYNVWQDVRGVHASDKWSSRHRTSCYEIRPFRASCQNIREHLGAHSTLISSFNAGLFLFFTYALSSISGPVHTIVFECGFFPGFALSISCLIYSIFILYLITVQRNETLGTNFLHLMALLEPSFPG